MREGHEDQHLMAALVNDFDHGVDAVGHIELKHFASICIDCTPADLEQLVDLGRCV